LALQTTWRASMSLLSSRPACCMLQANRTAAALSGQQSCMPATTLQRLCNASQPPVSVAALTLSCLLPCLPPAFARAVMIFHPAASGHQPGAAGLQQRHLQLPRPGRLAAQGEPDRASTRPGHQQRADNMPATAGEVGPQDRLWQQWGLGRSRGGIAEGCSIGRHRGVAA
jgi:hypothetical protein